MQWGLLEKIDGEWQLVGTTPHEELACEFEDPSLCGEDDGEDPFRRVLALE